MNAAKPFVCPAIGCNQQFANEDHLEVHRRKHEMSLGLRDFKSSLDTPIIADQTPTPTRFLKNCEEVGLFSELPNPFDAVFRRANITDDETNSGNNSSNNETETGSKDDVEGAPTVDAITVEGAITDEHSMPTTIADTTSTTTITSPPQDVSSTTEGESDEMVVTEVVESVSVTTESEPMPISLRKSSAADEEQQKLQQAQPQQVVHQPQQQQSLQQQSLQQALQQQQPTLAIVSTAAPVVKQTIAEQQVAAISMPMLNTFPISAPILLRLPNGQTIPVVPPSVSNPAYNIPIAVSAAVPASATTQQPTITETTTTIVEQPNVKLKLKNALLTSQSQGNLGVMTQAVEVVTRQQAVTSTSSMHIKPESPPSYSVVGKKRRGSEDMQDHKRLRFLERNRAAATRCRNKRKQWINDLESKADDLNNNNHKLQNEVTTLRNEVAQLKELLLAHKDCPVTMAQRKNAQLITGTSQQQSNNHVNLTSQPETIQIVNSQPETVRIINASAQPEMITINSSQPETVRIVNAQPETVRIVNSQPEVIEVVSTREGQRAIAMNIEQNSARIISVQSITAAQGPS